MRFFFIYIYIYTKKKKKTFLAGPPIHHSNYFILFSAQATCSWKFRCTPHCGAHMGMGLRGLKDQVKALLHIRNQSQMIILAISSKAHKFSRKKRVQSITYTTHKLSTIKRSSPFEWLQTQGFGNYCSGEGACGPFKWTLRWAPLLGAHWYAPKKGVH